MKRARIEALWKAQPTLTQRDVQRITGAPKATVRHVYRQLVAAGVLTDVRPGWTALEQAGAA